MSDITSMSSRGQVVIPLRLRERLDLREGEKFMVVGENDTVILKKIPPPSFENLDKLLKKTQDFARAKKLTKNDLQHAIKRARQ